MSEVTSEFEDTLRSWRERYAGRPRDELLRLFLLALEREQLVSMGYRESVLGRRLATLDVPEDVRILMRQALLWAWKDEEMHTIFIRGVLLRLARGPRRALIFTQQLAGAVAGWASSVRQHVPFRRAPLSNLVAGAVTLVGLLAGKVPRSARDQLDYGSFVEFCRFNVDAERTASLCWARIAELSASTTFLPAELTEGFERTRADEDRHERVFRTLAEALDDDDRLRPGVRVEQVEACLRDIGPFFLPPERRDRPVGEPAAGRGGPVYVLRGAEDGDKRHVLRQLLDQAGLCALVRERVERPGRQAGSLRVAIKPTFMIGYDRKDLSCVTDPVLVAELARVCGELGAGDVAVVDAPSIYDHFYLGRSVREVAHYLGFESPHYRLVDASEDQVPHAYARGMEAATVSRTWRDADLRVSFAKMRSNPVDTATLCVANVEGLGPRHDEFFFPERRAQRDTITMMLLQECPPHLALLDAYDSAADGILGMMGSPRPKRPRRLYAAGDALALDVVALRHMGVSDPDRSSLLREARHWFGDVRASTSTVGLDEPIPGWRGPHSSGLAAFLGLVAYPIYQYASGRGALFVPEMDESAFPLRTPPGLALRLGRRAVQTVFGIRHRR